MKRKPSIVPAFLNARVIAALALCCTGALLAVAAPGGKSKPSAAALAQMKDQAVPGIADLVSLTTAVSQDNDLRALRYLAPNHETELKRRMRHPLPQMPSPDKSDPVMPVQESAQAAAMPTPASSFDGMSAAQSGCACLPPDTHGDVGPNHYIQSVNSSIKIFDKSGNALNGPNGTTYNSFFAPMGAATPCGSSENDGDGFVFYDQMADRWVVSDFAFPSNGSVNYQCIGVSKTSDPVSGGWWLYALQIDPANPSWIGDYPKFGLWPDAYYLSVNLFNQTGNKAFEGVRVFALPRSAMINGTGAPNPGAVSFAITPATLGNAYSLVPATFRTGNAPPIGTAEYFLAINSSATGGTVENQVFAWRFHVDFANPANSTFGLGANHTPNGTITVNGFVDALTSTSTLLVPQSGTTATLDTLGDKLMTPLVYQNLGGTESLWASHTVNNNQNGTGPTAIRWYQFNVTGGNIPATPAQQQTFNNGGDGLWRWMPSIGIDAAGNMALNYTVSSASTNPAIRYAGRLATDPANTLGQGEAILIQGGGSQTHSSGRWGDYSGMGVDPSDKATFWLTNEYYSISSASGWNTRIGKFKFINAPVLVADTATVTADNCNSNGVIDPNETVTVSLGIKNNGTLATSNLVGTLQASGGVTNPSGPQGYGAIAVGATVSRSFTFTAGNIACGATVTATLQLQDGATNFGTIAYNFATGTVNITLAENFDAVVAPALPSRWAASNASGPAPLWVTSTTTPDTAPNDVFVDDPATVSDKRLDTPAITITSASAQVSFRHSYSFESGFDGGVLEVSAPNINGGAFTDITDPAVGGDFTSGGYNALISTSFSNPLAGRPAWTGSSGGYTTTTATLGPNVAGQNIKLRFRMGSDTSNSATGWRVDTVTVSNGYVCCGPAVIVALPAPALTAESYTPANGAPDPGETVTVNLSLSNTGGSNTSNLIATLQASGGVTAPGSPQSYGVITAGGAAVARPFTFTANGNCGDTITLTLSLQDGALNLGTVTYKMLLGTTSAATQTFSNSNTITIPATGSGGPTGSPATPYPSNITVSGVPTNFTKVAVTFVGMNHTFPDDVDVLLVSPTGHKMIVLSDAGGGNDWTNATITLDDSAANALSDDGSNPSGAYKPGNFGTVQDPFPSPAPVGTYLTPAPGGTDTLTSAFVGQNPNGVWSLYVVDDDTSDVGSFTGGWQLTFTLPSTTTCVTQAPSINNGPPPSPVIVGTPYSFTFTANGNPAPTFSLAGGTLPMGLSLSSGGLLSGTATSGGTGIFSNIMVTASNGLLPNSTETFSLTTATVASNYIASFGLTGVDAGYLVDYDGDGLTNLMEYALGLDPTMASVAGLPVVTLKDYGGTLYLSMIFHRSSLATDLTYTVQASGDLSAWSNLAASSAGAVTSGPGFIGETGAAPNFNVEVRDTVPYDPVNSPHRFMRLQVTSP